MEKTSSARTIFGHFRQFYNDERENIPLLTQRLRDVGRCTLHLTRSEAKELWNPPAQIVFEKVNIFERRLVTIVKIFQLIQEFSRLSRVELSAMGGRSLTVQVQNICTQFCDLKTPIVSGQFGDCMDPDNGHFEKMAAEFQNAVVELEDKMTSIVSNALSDATTPLNAYRVIQLLGSFLERPGMMQKVKESFPRIVGLALQEITTCIDYLKSLPPPGDAPCIVSSVRQIQQISKRAKSHLMACGSLGIDTDVHGMRSLEEKYRYLEDLVKVKMDHHIDLWTARMNQVVIFRSLFLIDRPTKRVISGADLAMARLVTECRSLEQLMDPNAIPQSWHNWTTIYDSLKTKMKMVDIIVSCCSGVESSITPSTRSLLEPRLLAIKADIAEKTQSGTWIWSNQDQELITDLRNMAQTTLRLHQCMKKFASTAENIQQMATVWGKTPVIEFQEGLLPAGEQLSELLNKKYAEYATVSKKIVALVTETQQLLPDLQPNDWKTYLEMIDDLILEGLYKAVSNSYIHFIDLGNKGYFYELHLNITTEGISFSPPLETGNNAENPNNSGMLQQFGVLINGVAKIASSMTPLSGKTNFQNSIDSNASIKSLQRELTSSITSAVSGISQSVHSLEQYAFVWNTDPNTYLHNFLHYTSLLGEYVAENQQQKPANLQDFKLQLVQLREWKTIIRNCIKETEKMGKTYKLKINVKPAVAVSNCST